MWRLTTLLAVALMVGCGGSSSEGDTTPPRSSASLRVVWAGGTTNSHDQFGVVLVGPADGIAMKGRVDKPDQRSTIFTHRARNLTGGYFLDVRASRCDDARCDAYNPNNSLCVRMIRARRGESLTAVVTLSKRRTCTIDVTR